MLCAVMITRLSPGLQAHECKIQAGCERLLCSASLERLQFCDTCHLSIPAFIRIYLVLTL